MEMTQRVSVFTQDDKVFEELVNELYRKFLLMQKSKDTGALVVKICVEKGKIINAFKIRAGDLKEHHDELTVEGLEKPRYEPQPLNGGIEQSVPDKIVDPEEPQQQ
jgi:hypothetical protein